VSVTVNFGIDLGTTNSAIAHMARKGPEVIPIRRLMYSPSVVAVDKRGELKVGVDALQPALGYARWFKRLMGTNSVVTLGDGSTWTPSQLSAEVLKALKAAARLKTNEDVGNVVITVPAMFTQPQCAATLEAAKLAGMNAVALLQEPIAAATAYLSSDPIPGTYLVYDLGGGTFDVSLVRLFHGEMNVIGHGGDNFLGGADFDRALFDWVCDQIDRRGGDVTQFKGGAARLRLMTICEDARIALSDEETVSLYLDDFELPVAKLEMSRGTLEDLIESAVTRTIDIAKERLAAAGVVLTDVRSILLVGGPTQMPYVRRRLEQDLGIPLNLEEDPMTVVARGAAIHASTILAPPTQAVVETFSDEARMDLFYEPVSPEDVTSLAGKVTSPPGFAGAARVCRKGGDWETGWIGLRNSAFQTDLRMGKESISEFLIELRDPLGTLVPCDPKSIFIRSGVRAAQAVTPYNYAIVLEGGTKVGRIVRAGTPLPASGFSEFRIAKTLRSGSDDVLKIYFVEGLSGLADENVKVGDLEIRGTDIKRTLRENERIEIRIRMDESRTLTAAVHIPLLDEDYSVELHSIQEAPDLEDLRFSIDETRSALVGVEEFVEPDEQSTLLQAGRMVEQLEAMLERVEQGEIGEAERIAKQLSDAKSSIRPLRDKYALIAKHRETIDLIEQAGILCRLFADCFGGSNLEDLNSEADKALRLSQLDGIDAIYNQAADIFWEHYRKTRECWEAQVELMEERAANATDALAYHDLLRRAQAALEREDFEMVRLSALRSRELLPALVTSRNRFQDAALR